MRISLISVFLRVIPDRRDRGQVQVLVVEAEGVTQAEYKEEVVVAAEVAAAEVPLMQVIAVMQETRVTHRPLIVSQ